MTLVIDLSHHNIIPESLQPAWDYGVRGLIHKVTEGLSFTDSKYQARYSMVYGTPMLWGVYHFIRPGNIEEQATYFLRQSLSVSDSDTLYVCDYEDAEVSLEDVLLFMQLIEQEVNTSPVIYSGHVLKEKMADQPLQELTRFRLWLAQYSNTYTLPKGWDNYFLWQYTDQGSVPGIEPPTDLNNFDGIEAALRLQWCMPKVDLKSTEETAMAYPTADDTYPPSPAEPETAPASSLPTNVEQREEVKKREEEEWNKRVEEMKREPPPPPETKPLVTETTTAEQEAGKKALDAIKAASDRQEKQKE